MATVQVENLVVGKKYIVDGAVKTLTQKTFNDHPQNPSFTLTFDNGEPIRNDWQVKYVEASEGGKRKSRINRKTRRKSKKNRRKSNHRR